MSTTQLNLNLSDLQSTCNFIVSHFFDAVAGGMAPRDAWERYTNQLRGLLFLPLDTVGENIVLSAIDRLLVEYQRFQNGSVSPDAPAVQEVA